jgi:hypothetical protein
MAKGAAIVAVLMAVFLLGHGAPPVWATRAPAPSGVLCDGIPEVIRAARRAGVRIFAIDGRLLAGFPSPDPYVPPVEWHTYWTSTQASLRMLSDETGGFAFLESTDVEGALRNIRIAMR